MVDIVVGSCTEGCFEATVVWLWVCVCVCVVMGVGVDMSDRLNEIVSGHV